MSYKAFCKSVLWAITITGQILMYGTYSILVNLSKVDGEIPFYTSSLVLVTEVLKLLICLVLVLSQGKSGQLLHIPFYDTILYSVPAACYMLNNNLSIFMQTQMDPATYMILGNFKILATGLLYQVVMKQKLSSAQWLSLGLLTVGGAMSSITALNTSVQSVSEIHCTWVGLATMAVYCFVSGFSGVFVEYKFKTCVELSFIHQNILLYSFGVIFNFCLWIWQNIQQRKESKTNHSFQLFEGYSFTVWMLVLTQSVVGLVMSMVVKYKSNMTRVFIISSAPLVTTFFSCIFFHLHLQPLFMFATICVVIATFMYNMGYIVSIGKLKPTIKMSV